MTKPGILFMGLLIAATSVFAIGCEEEPTTGTGGSAGSGGEGGSGGGGNGGGGSGGGMMMSAVEKYCTDIMANCTGANAQYASKESCMGAAAAFAPGMDTDTSGNTLGCRVYHTGAAAGDAATHCVHAGPAGGDACGKTCEGFCAVATVVCPNEFKDTASCTTSCEGWTSAMMPYNTSFTAGNTTECRLYHLSVAATDATQAATHCPHTITQSPTCM